MRFVGQSASITVANETPVERNISALTQHYALDIAGTKMEIGKDRATSEADLIDKLAGELVWKMEHLDPSDLDWENLSDRERHFYRMCIEHILRLPECAYFFSPTTTR